MNFLNKAVGNNYKICLSKAVRRGYDKRSKKRFVRAYAIIYTLVQQLPANDYMAVRQIYLQTPIIILLLLKKTAR